MRAARAFVLGWHRVLGLCLGGALALMGLTGAALVFYLELDRGLNPAVRVAPPRSGEARTVASPQAVLEVLRAAYPDLQGPWRLEYPLNESSPWAARYYRPPARAERSFAPLMVTLDPDTLRITSARYWGDTAMTWIYDLHYQLLWDRNGRVLVGWLGWVLLLSMAGGIFLWWPSRRRFVSALKPAIHRGRVRGIYDLHALTGVYATPLLVVVALTGIGLAWPQPTQNALSGWAPVRGVSVPLPDPAAAGLAPLNLDDAARVALRQFPNAEPRWIESSGARGEPIMLRLYQPFEPSRRFPHTQLWLHAHTADVLAIKNPQDATSSETVIAWLHALHNAEVFGWVGRSIYVLIGWVPVLMLVTGVIRWRQKRRARGVAAQRRLP